MEESPMAAIKKKESSMIKAISVFKQVQADAILSTGGTGAFLTGTTLLLGRLKGIKRPALVSPFPTVKKGEYTTILDIGANTVCTLEEMQQFALMGNVYHRAVFEVETPRVMLLSNGTEDHKGTPLIQETHKVLREEKRLDFKGNIEARMTSTVTSLDKATHNDGARLLKYEIDKSGTYKYCENDFVLMRFAEVLYTQYEAALRAGLTDVCEKLLADPEFQRIRTRAGCAPYAALDLDELLDERGREFAWEMLRRRDLIRYDRYAKGEWDFKKASEDNHHDWFPIPRKMIETSGGLWEQNPGYETDK
jgi:hypothetical protein